MEKGIGFTKKIEVLIFFSLGLVILDRLSKWFILTFPDLYFTLPNFAKQNLGGQDSLIELKLFKNQNLYFISLNQKFLYILIGAVLLLLLFFFFKTLKQKSLLLTTGFSLIILGGASNFFDRIYFGYVIDWLKIFILPISIFNIADVMIIAGIICILLYYYITKRKE